MTLRPKLMIVGHARHGKDTLCEMLAKHGYTFQSSSRFALEAFIYNMVKDEYGLDIEAAYADRVNRREFWYNCIRDYNNGDETRLGRALFAHYDMYCGCRSGKELAALREAKVIDFTIWISRMSMPPEDSSSMTVKPFQSDHTIYNNGTLVDLEEKVDKLYHGFLKPWESRLANPEPALPESPKVKYEET